MHLRQRILAQFSVVTRHMTMRAMDYLFILKLRLDALFLWFFGRTFCMRRLKREENLTGYRLYNTMVIHNWHVMGLYTGERAWVYQLLHWEFVAVINKISNIMANGKNNSCRMFTQDSKHLPTPTCASTLHNVHIQECPTDTNPKNAIHESSNWINFTLGNILQYLFFNLWP